MSNSFEEFSVSLDKDDQITMSVVDDSKRKLVSLDKDGHIIRSVVDHSKRKFEKVLEPKDLPVWCEQISKKSIIRLLQSCNNKKIVIEQSAIVTLLDFSIVGIVLPLTKASVI